MPTSSSSTHFLRVLAAASFAGTIACVPRVAGDDSDPDNGGGSMADHTLTSATHTASSESTGPEVDQACPDAQGGRARSGALGCVTGVCDCPPGEKCAVYFLGNDALATKCVPLVGDLPYGDTCTPTLFDPPDECQKDLFCSYSNWIVPGPSTCRQLCDPSDRESCEKKSVADAVCYQLDVGVGVCELLCDPFANDCPQGQRCVPNIEHFLCRGTFPDAAGVGEPCPCEPRLICVDGRDTGWPEDEHYYCAQFCDLEDEQATCPEQQTCQPIFDDPDDPPADPAHARVGYCEIVVGPGS
ncbi:MAG: hypothetical protein V3V08_19055 [Nannocystaceae bacterium]